MDVMKNWLKQQTTEVTAWAGFFIVITALFAPRWVLVALGVLLICWDDKSASAWLKKHTPWFEDKTDGAEL